MATVLGIVNNALSLLGDAANVSSIDPPDGSVQAAMCARFYPVAIGEVIASHPWGFATTRTTLAQVASPSPAWVFAYAAPVGVVEYLSVQDINAGGDYNAAANLNWAAPMADVAWAIPPLGTSVPQQFAVETDAAGNALILTNLPNAVLRHTTTVVDPARFDALFADAVAHLLAAKLAGPLLKGADGRNESRAQLQAYQYALGKAKAFDSNNRKVDLVHVPLHIRSR
jgi:hypothetical protein